MKVGDDDNNPVPPGVTAISVEPPLTLRDYFAASALQGLATRRPAGVPTSATELARFAFEIADAMLAERQK